VSSTPPRHLAAQGIHRQLRHQRLPPADFADNSSNTATTLGKDTSGNGNNWTPNNLSVTAGAGNDSLVDSPTNGTASSGGDAGGTVVGNYCDVESAWHRQQIMLYLTAI
jgi:hypothetical protein